VSEELTDAREVTGVDQLRVSVQQVEDLRRVVDAATLPKPAAAPPHEDGPPATEQAGRVEVVVSTPHTEVERLPGYADLLTASDDLSPMHRDRREVGVRAVEPVGMADRHVTLVGDHPGEGDRPRADRDDRVTRNRGVVQPTVAGRITVRRGAERIDDGTIDRRPVRRSGDRASGCRGRDDREDGGGDERDR
jgi:hypothetical protein